MIAEVIVGGVGLAVAADIAKWCFNAAAASERESRGERVRAERQYRAREVQAEREHRRAIEREARQRLREEMEEQYQIRVQSLQEAMTSVWEMKRGTEALVPKFMQIIKANLNLMRDSPLTEQQRKAVRDNVYQLERGIARLRAFSGPYLQGFIEQLRDPRRKAREEDFTAPDLPEPMLPTDFPVVGDHLGLSVEERQIAQTTGYVDLGFGQRGRVIGKPSAEELCAGLFVSDYDGDNEWLLSSARGHLASAGGAVEARVIEAVRGGLLLVWNASSREAVKLFLPVALSHPSLRNAPCGTRTKVYVHDTDYRMRLVTVGVKPPECSDDAGLRLPVVVNSAETQKLLARIAVESPITFWRRPCLPGDPTNDVVLILRVGSGEEFAARRHPGSDTLQIGEKVAWRFGTVDCLLYRSAVELAVNKPGKQGADTGVVSAGAFVNLVDNRLAEQEELLAVFKEEALETRKYQLLLEAELEAAGQASRLETVFDGQHSLAAVDEPDRPAATAGEIVRFLLPEALLRTDLAQFAVEVFDGGTERSSAVLRGWVASVDESGRWVDCAFVGKGLARLRQGGLPNTGILRFSKVDADIQRQVRALEQFRSASVLQGKSAEDREAFRRLRRVLLGLPEQTMSSLPGATQDESSQDRAARLIAGGGPLTLVLGPPGTGKTETITRGVAQFLAESPDARVAIVSQANVAVDEALRKLKARLPECDITRHVSAYAADSLMESSRAFTQHTRRDEFFASMAHEQHGLPDWATNVRAEFRRLCQEDEALQRRVLKTLVGSSSVYGATLSMLGRIAVGMPLFDLVIVDEAAKASLPECLIAAMCAKRLVLVGDHHQLLPFVDEQMLERAGPDEVSRREVEELWNNSLFRRLWDSAPDNCKAFLSTQYRGRPAIARAVSTLFYAGRVETGKSNDSGLVPSECSLVWVDTKGHPGDHIIRDGSIYNRREGDVVMAVLQMLADCLPHPKKTSVAVIAAYREQRGLLIEWGRRAGLTNAFAECEVRTVDSTQGGQWDIVVLSLARCSGSSHFPGNPNRLNVALSRARELAVVVGSLRYALDRPDDESHLPALAAHFERHKGDGVWICAPGPGGSVANAFGYRHGGGRPHGTARQR
jgi:hypothetical protein